MKQEILNNLKLGEKAADIQEYYWGTNGERLVYKVTIYTCEKIPFLKIFKKRGINEYVVPFYFETKELAQEYIEYSDKVWFRPLTGAFNGYALFLTNYEKQKYEYYLVSAVDYFLVPVSEDHIMCKGGVWNGKVNFGSYRRPYKTQSIYFTQVFEKEKRASKEGTIGETFSYKLYNINDGKQYFK